MLECHGPSLRTRDSPYGPRTWHGSVALERFGRRKLSSDVKEARREKSGKNGRDLKINNNGWKRTEQERKMLNALEKVAKEVGVGERHW